MKILNSTLKYLGKTLAALRIVDGTWLLLVHSHPVKLD